MELLAIALVKTFPTAFTVIKPFPEFRAGRQFLAPVIELEIGPGHATGPEAINKYPTDLVVLVGLGGFEGVVQAPRVHRMRHDGQPLDWMTGAEQTRITGPRRPAG